MKRKLISIILVLALGLTLLILIAKIHGVHPPS